MTNLQTVTLKARDIHIKMVGNVRTTVATVPTNAFLKTRIPNKANSREFTGEKNPAVKAMRYTLIKEPEMFYSKNLGIRMVASTVIPNRDSLTLYFGEDEGIFNGGHTYEVLKLHGVESANVEIVIQEGLPKAKLVEISLALNMSKKLELTSQNEKVGAFQWIKDKLPDEPIIYKEGGDGVYLVQDVLKVANIYKKGLGKNFGVGNLTQAQKGISQLLKDNMENQALRHTEFVLADVWNLYKRVKTDPIIIGNLPKKYAKKEELTSNDLVLVLLTGAQYMMDINKNGFPLWSNGNNGEKALKFIQKASKTIGKTLNSSPFKDLKEGVQKDAFFHERVKNIFLQELR